MYFERWEKKYRSASVLAHLRHRRCLAEVCLSFCGVIISIEERPTKECSFSPRSITLIILCLNLGTYFPQPREYAGLWRKSQEVCPSLRGGLRVAVCLHHVYVFCCAMLESIGIRGLRWGELIGPLTNIFQEYRGQDLIRLAWSRRKRVDSFAGIPFKGNGISVVASDSVGEEAR